MMTATTPATLELTGASGKKYTFHIFAYGTEFKPAGGIYAFTLATQKPAGGFTHSILYIGQTGDLSQRFDDHHKEDCFTRRGANRHCAMVVENEETRLAIEADLIAAYNPPCNG
jgi:hypothetical protein